jgi:FkbM family methyltransferase
MRRDEMTNEVSDRVVRWHGGEKKAEIIVKHSGVDVEISLPDRPDYIVNCIVGFNCFYECDLLDYIRIEHPNQKTIVDVGANIGNHVRFFETFVNHDSLVCFEPDADNYATLARNARSPKTRVYRVALGDGYKRVSLSQQVNDNCGSMTVTAGEDVSMVPLDACNLRDVTLLKIDVEGYELPVLRGGLNTIKRDRPRIFLELTKEVDEIFALFGQIGYAVGFVFEWNGIKTFEFYPKV